MKRRHLLTGAVTASALATINSCSKFPFINKNETIEWRMITGYNQEDFQDQQGEFLPIYKGGQNVCEYVKKMSGGRFIIKFEQKDPSNDVLKDVDDGIAECGYTAAYHSRERYPALIFSTAVPFGLNAQQQNAWLYQAGGLELMQNIYQEYGLNIIQFPAGNTGAQMGGWFKKAINRPEDLKEVEMRIPRLGGEVMRKLGVTPTNQINNKTLLGKRITNALKQKSIDAAEWTGPHDDLAIGLTDVQDLNYYYYPGWWEPSTTIEIQVNLKAWENLSPEYREIFQAACYQANMKMLAEYDYKNSIAIEKIVNLGRINVLPFSQEILQQASKAAEEVNNQFGGNDILFQEVLQEWSKFRERIFNWHGMNELGYLLSLSNTKAPS